MNPHSLIRKLKCLVILACLTVVTPIAANAQPEPPGNTVTVLSSGYVKPVYGKELIPGVSDSGARHVASTVTLIKGKDVIIIADPGMVSERAQITDALRQQGVEPEQVTHVFISHHHPDHTVNISLFPNATVVDFWATYKVDLWKDHGDRYEIAPGITVLRTPGHTLEDASLLVNTANGTYALTHLWWLPDRTPAEDPLAYSQTELQKHREAIDDIADWIIPGHGGMFKNTNKH